MNQEKIGQFIALQRKERKLTQKELAEKLNVTNRSVSKWETGQCLPDVSLFEPLCNILNMDINELLAGEKLDKGSKERNKEVINFIEYSKKKNKIKVLVISLVSLFLIAIIILGTYFINNFNKTTIYELSGESENFRYSGGLLVVSNYKNVLSSGKVSVNNSELENVEILDVTLKSNNNIIVGGNKFFDGDGLIQEDYGYGEILNKEKVDNIDNWYLEIYYVVDNNLSVEKIDVNNEIVSKNNKFLIFKVGEISKEKEIKNEIDSKYDDGNFEYEIALMRYLEKKGYTHNVDSYSWMEKNIREYDEKTGEGVSIDPFWPRIMYRNKIDNNNYYLIQWTFMNPQSIKSPSFVVEGEFYGEKYSFSYNIEEDSIDCFEGECPGSAWEDAIRFLNDFDDIINFEGR